MKTPIVLIAAALFGPSAFAVDDDVTIERTTVTYGEVEPSAFKNEAFGIKPQFGVTTRRFLGNDDARAVVGALFDFNFLRRTETEEGRPWLGITFGGLYSHLGGPGSNILGLEGDVDADLVQIPLNLKAGYTFSDVFRLTAHGGSLPMYQSNPTNLDIDTFNWNWNVGADLEFGVGRSVGLTLRPDWTFAENDTFFTGTLGVDIPLS